jgi:hypothetical protein
MMAIVASNSDGRYSVKNVTHVIKDTSGEIRAGVA